MRGLKAMGLAITLFSAAAGWSAGQAVSGEDRAGPPGSDGRTSAIISDVSKSWFSREWSAYRATFVTTDGRVVDNANGGISHSEGQGYGLLLAVAAGDRTGFATIWRWTSAHLRQRQDALFAWKWDPDKQQVTDLNNASDGDVLIAWALAKAAKSFGRADYEVEARRIVEALASKALVKSPAGPLLLPAASGFEAKTPASGPVINLSYWIFDAFRAFARVDPHHDWDGLRRNGFRLLEASRFGVARLPTDWIAVGSADPTPAAGFDPLFGYGALRIPLYLVQDPDAPREILARFARTGTSPMPAVVDVETGAVREPLQAAGYRMLLAAARCAIHGEPIPPELMSGRDTLYYPATLRLLCIAALQERLPRCL